MMRPGPHVPAALLAHNTVDTSFSTNRNWNRTCQMSAPRTDLAGASAGARHGTLGTANGLNGVEATLTATERAGAAVEVHDRAEHGMGGRDCADRYLALQILLIPHAIPCVPAALRMTRYGQCNCSVQRQLQCNCLHARAGSTTTSGDGANA